MYYKAYQELGRCFWDTRPYCVTCRIREGLLCSRGNPCHFLEVWDEIAWHNQEIRVIKGQRDGSPVKERCSLSLFPPSISQGPPQHLANCTMICPRVSHGSAWSELTPWTYYASPQTGLSLSQWQQSQSAQCLVAPMGKEPTLSLNTLRTFEAVASLQRPLAPRRDKTPS